MLTLTIRAIPTSIVAVKMYTQCIKKAEEVVDKELLY